MKAAIINSITKMGLATGLLAGAVLILAPAQATAQQYGFGVQFGQPAYYGYDDGRRDFYQHERFEHEQAEAIARHEAWERQQAYLRHEAWEHQDGYGRGFDGYGRGGDGYGRGGDGYRREHDGDRER